MQVGMMEYFDAMLAEPADRGTCNRIVDLLGMSEKLYPYALVLRFDDLLDDDVTRIQVG